MRRWLAVLLLVFLPLQSAWAAAGVYCQHERGEAANHFGHHEHRHVTPDNSADTDSDASGRQSADNDCSFHLNGFPGFTSRQHLPMLPTVAVFGESRFPRYASHIPDGPDQPDIALAA
ncbi:MAG: hypothetical protein LBL48_06015 [Azoarcus sp.]|jgi:hypothetical protein|nr:hypothetical protein [Azoarcus sp.]